MEHATPSLPASCLLAQVAIACGNVKMKHVPALSDPGLTTLYLAGGCPLFPAPTPAAGVRRPYTLGPWPLWLPRHRAWGRPTSPLTREALTWDSQKSQLLQGVCHCCLRPVSGRYRVAKGRATEGPGKWLPRVCTENEVAKIPAHAFLGLPNLEWLDLSKNKLDALGLHPHAFKVRRSPSSCSRGAWRGKRAPGILCSPPCPTWSRSCAETQRRGLW